MKRCMGCMKEYGEQKSVCPSCGYSEEQIRREAAEFPEILAPGTILEQRFIIGRPLSASDYSYTYMAWDELLRRRVVMKEFFPIGLVRRSAEERLTALSGKNREIFEKGKKDFETEFYRLHRNQDLEEPAAFYKLVRENNTLYVVMEYIRGCSLLDYMEAGLEGLNASREDILNGLMNAVGHLHSRGIGHYNLSPDNIYIDENGRFRLLDFGEAKKKLYDLSGGRISCFQAEYTAPELLLHKNTGLNADVYAVGAIGYELYSGKMPPDCRRRYKRKLKLKNARISRLVNQLAELRAEKRPENAAEFIKTGGREEKRNGQE